MITTKPDTYNGVKLNWVSNTQLRVTYISNQSRAEVNKITRLYGSGMLVINSPWKLDEKTKDNLSYIANCIYKNGCPSYNLTMY